MIDTRLILLEGLPSTGKTTNAQFLQIQLERNGYKTKWIHEVTRPHPTSFFNEAGFTYLEFAKFADALNSVAVFRKNTVGIDLLEVEWNDLYDLKSLQEYDTWNFPHEKYKYFALDKWEHFAEEALRTDEIYIIDGSIFQFQIFSFLFENVPYIELESFVNKLFDIIRPLNPSLIYFYRENVEATIRYLENDRGIQYLENMRERDKAWPYYQDKPTGAEGFKQFLRDYARFAELLFDSVSCKKVSIEISNADWNRYENEMLVFLEIKPLNGVYINEELNFEIKLDGLKIIDPCGNERKLIPKSANEFYVECLPTVLKFENAEQIVISGMQILERWTTTGTVYKKGVI